MARQTKGGLNRNRDLVVEMEREDLTRMLGLREGETALMTVRYAGFDDGWTRMVAHKVELLDD